MRVVRNDVVVIGAGPAGLAAAISAKKAGAKRITIVERDFYLGGILQQCIHQGFGLKYFNKEFTGPEYAQEFIEQVKKHDISIMSETMALELRTGSLLCVNSNGLIKLEAGAFVTCYGVPGAHERKSFRTRQPTGGYLYSWNCAADNQYKWTYGWQTGGYSRFR